MASTADTLTLDVFCSKGTYIRSLAEDIGHNLGCGGTIIELRRTQAGQFKLEDALTIEQCQAMPLEQLMASLLSVDQPLQEIPMIELSTQQAVLI